MNRPTHDQHSLIPMGRAFRSPKRLTITLPFGTYQRLLDRSDHEGRSLSNLAAFLLETATSSQEEHLGHAA
jgi:hypothetical protein